MDELSKLMSKKPSVKMSPEEIQAKMETVMELLTMAQEAMGGSVKSGMDELMAPKEVSSVEVSAADPESLEEGLETAQDLVSGDDEEMLDADISTAKEDDEDEDDENPFKKKKKPLFDMF